MTIALFIVGRSGSGKTTLSKMLEPLGVFRISASTQLANLYLSEFGMVPSRLELANYGKMLLQNHRLEKFHLAIGTEMKKRGTVSVDGLRFKASINEVSKYAHRCALIFLTCSKQTRESRLSLTISNNILQTLNSHETEIAVDAMLEQADFVIDTSQPIDIAFVQLRSALNSLRAE